MADNGVNAAKEIHPLHHGAHRRGERGSPGTYGAPTWCSSVTSSVKAALDAPAADCDRSFDLVYVEVGHRAPPGWSWNRLP